MKKEIRIKKISLTFFLVSFIFFGIITTPAINYTIWFLNLAHKQKAWTLGYVFNDLTSVLNHLLKYFKLHYYKEIFIELKNEIKFHYNIFKKSLISWIDLYMIFESIESELFVSEWTVWALNNSKYKPFYLYWRLYVYGVNTYNIHLTFSTYLSFKGEYDIIFTKTNSYFNGIYIPTQSVLFSYSELYYPVIFTAVWYKSFKTLLLTVIITSILGLLLINFFYINLLKQLAIWAIIGLLFFWLMSGFNFFLKRYRYGKFTSAILRFWKRTNAIFWIVEGFLFSLFFYYYLNSSQEPLYFYDTSSLNQDYLVSLPNVYFNYLLLVALIWYSYYILLKLPQFVFKQYLLHLTLVTLLFIYIFLIESYQVYYVLTMFYESTWLFDGESNVWVLESESPRLRAKQQYLVLALIAKYWHFLFIFLSWLFFIFKSFEQKRVHYALFTSNIQNLIILFILNILFIAQWFKWLFRRFYDNVYYWFFTDSNMFSINFIFNEFVLLLKNFFSFSVSIFSLNIQEATSLIFNLNYLV